MVTVLSARVGWIPARNRQNDRIGGTGQTAQAVWRPAGGDILSA